MTDMLYKAPLILPELQLGVSGAQDCRTVLTVFQRSGKSLLRDTTADSSRLVNR